MQIFKTGQQVTRAVKNVQRLRQILTAFGRHGFQEFVTRAGFGGFVSTSSAEHVDSLTIPERLKLVFEELGPTFVKFGQLLSNRPDLIPETFVEELKKLQDDVAPAPFEVMKAQIERELGGKIEDFFSTFNTAPLASASIGQVYEATLKSGEEVVVKVQRPDIGKIINNDISILSFLAESIEKYIPETRIISPVSFVEEFFTSLNYELDFFVEANNILKIGENLKGNDKVVIPKVYRSCSTKKILTMERLKGVKITDTAKLKELGINPKELVDAGVRAFFKMVVTDGLFHGDLHGGNIFAIKDPVTGASKIGLVDFGIVGRLSPSSRQSFSRMCIAIMTEDFETLCYEYADLGAVGAGVDFDMFQREVRNSLSPYMGLSIKDVNMGQVLIKSTKIALKYNIRIPSDWMIVFKAIFSLEGLGKQLDPDFDFLAIGHDLIKTTVKDKYTVDKFMKEFNWLSRDVISLIEVAPRQIRWMMKKFNSNDFAFEVKFREFETLRKQIDVSFKRTSNSIITAGFFIASALSLNSQTDHLWKGYPIPSVIFFAAGCFGLFRPFSKNNR